MSKTTENPQPRWRKIASHVVPPVVVGVAGFALHRHDKARAVAESFARGVAETRAALPDYIDVHRCVLQPPYLRDGVQVAASARRYVERQPIPSLN